MHLCYRVVDPAGGHHDVRIVADGDASVGEVAAAIASSTGIRTVGPDGGRSAPATLTISTAASGVDGPDPEAPAIDAAPRSGSTVRLVGTGSGRSGPPRWSPASLRPSGSAIHRTRLAYGSTDLGAARIHVGRTVTVHATRVPDRLEVDGRRVLGGTDAAHGALVRVGTEVFTLDIAGPLHPPETGPWRHHGSVPAVSEHHAPTPIDLPAPPPEDRTPGFPMLSAVVPLLMGAAMWAATRSTMVAGFALFSVAFVVASGIEVRREHRRDRRFREWSFRQDLAGAASRARRLRDEELARLGRDLPSGADVARWPDGDATRIWERRGEPGSSLQVRIGVQRLPPADPVRIPGGGREDLRTELHDVASELTTLDRPSGIDLAHTALGIAGRDDGARSLTRSLVAQLIATVGPDRLGIVVDTTVERAAAWAWLRWLPHEVQLATGGVGDLPEQPSSDRAVLTVIDRTLTDRGLVSGPVVVVAGSPAELPDGLDASVAVADDGATVRRSDGPPEPLDAEAMSIEACEHLARGLSALRGGDPDHQVLPAAVALDEVIADRGLLEDDDLVREGWRRSREDRRALRAPIGRSAFGPVHIDLRADGPHGLVAGMTGAGKSELLRTL
ncbi:MAG: hypothetical protein JST64_06760, partial [Actinobacteria bacterium]|nr:hypothetical protein [Actinomycetota bacterium]